MLLPLSVPFPQVPKCVPCPQTVCDAQVVRTSLSLSAPKQNSNNCIATLFVFFMKSSSLFK